MMVCLSGPAGLLLANIALATFSALIVYIVRRRRSSTHTVPTPDVEAFTEKPRTPAVGLAEKSEPAQHTEWLPPNHFDGNPWLARILAEADSSTAELHPVLREFQATIEDDPILYMLFTRMFYEVPEAQDPTGRPQVKDYQHMLKAFVSSQDLKLIQAVG